MIKLVHWMPWTGNPTRVSHNTGYRQDDPGVIDAQIRCMKAAGFGGVIAWWQGPFHLFTHSSFLQMFYACLKSDMAFIPALDGWIAKGQPVPTNVVISALTSDDFKGMMPFFAEKWILEFDLASVGVNLAQVQQAVPGATLLSKHTGYSWPEITNTWTVLKADNANAQMKIPCVFSRFNDGGYPLPNGVGDPAHFNGQRDWNKSVWGGGATRLIDERSGQNFIDSSALAMINSTVKYSGLVTWNDYDENTEHEPEYSRLTGIRIGS